MIRFLCLVIVLLSSPVFAQDGVSPSITLKEMNRIKPLQNPRYIHFEDILDRRIVDSRSKVVGEMKDVIINQDGAIVWLLVNFDRLHLRKSVYLDYIAMDVESMDDAYRLPFNSEELAGLYKKLTTALPKDQELFSLSEIMGRSVVNANEENIADVAEILFNQEGRAVDAYYLNVSYKTIRNQGVAIPFAVPLESYKYQKMRFLVPQSWSDLILDYADK